MMNEFTKDELIELNIVLCIWIEKYTSDKTIRNVQSKVVSMLDSYYKSKRSCLCTFRESCPNCAEGF
jgi:hypothetical protein